jgi:hypothetical protein
MAIPLQEAILLLCREEHSRCGPSGLIHLEDEGDILLRDVGCYKKYTALLYPRKQNSSCKISGFHGGDYEECRPLECAVWLLLTIDVSEERIASTIKMTRIGELGTTLAVTRN